MSIHVEEDDENRKTNLSLFYDRYKDMFTTFPKETGWMTEDLYMYQGFWHQSKIIISVETTMAAQETFQAHPNDIYIATLPKSGTTWLKSLMFSIVNRNEYQKKSFSTSPLLIHNPHKLVPFIETEVLRNNPTYVDGHSPRLFATHIPYTSLPRSIIDCGCRIVYMCRNPKDVLVSLFHFANKVRDKSRGLMTFEEAFSMFSKGIIPNGPYWEHVKGYHKVSLEHPTRILFLTYESMKVDTVNNVNHLAEFLGCPFTEEEKENGVVEQIVRLCSFENLSEVNKYGNLREGVANNVHFRKGEVGDWSNHLTDEMSQIVDQITKEKFHGLDISFEVGGCDESKT